jgi:hypothetical protein
MSKAVALTMACAYFVPQSSPEVIVPGATQLPNCRIFTFVKCAFVIARPGISLWQWPVSPENWLDHGCGAQFSVGFQFVVSTRLASMYKAMNPVASWKL